MKLLIGIMHTIENEFEQCIESIKSQTHQDFDYFVIQNLPNKQAHDKLYKTFMDNAGKYDLFIKIDADMVLVRSTFFEEVIEKMQSDPELDNLQIAVQDFYTDSLIHGLNIFRNRVKWKISNEKIFVDRIIDKVRKGLGDKTELAPAAYHCPNPSAFQSFHFGLHKAVKVMQAGSNKLNEQGSTFHWENILKIKNNYKKSKHIQLAYALLGAHIALKNHYSHQEVNFDNPLTKTVFEKYKTLPPEKIHQLAEKTVDYLDPRFPQLQYEWIVFRNHYTQKWAIKRFSKFIFYSFVYTFKHFFRKNRRKAKL